MEFVRVLFPTSRRVRIDGPIRGTTNRTLQVEAGTHRFSLAGDADYSPPFDDETVAGTTADFPLVVQFMPLAATAGPETASLDAIAPAPAPRRAAKRRPAKRKKPAKKKPAKKKTAAKKPAAKKTRKAAKKKRPASKSKAAKRARR